MPKTIPILSTPTYRGAKCRRSFKRQPHSQGTFEVKGHSRKITKEQALGQALLGKQRMRPEWIQELTRPPIRALPVYKEMHMFEDKTLRSSKLPMSNELCDAIALKAFEGMRDTCYLNSLHKSEQQFTSIAMSSLLGTQDPDISGENFEVHLGNALKDWRNKQTRGGIMDLYQFIKADSFPVDEYLALEWTITSMVSKKQTWMNYF